MSRLRLTHLTFVGADVEAASVEFGPATTIIHGPSDTGKSFIVDAIDFMLGAKELKDIPEREGYSTVLLGLLLPSGEPVTLSRSVRGGRFGFHPDDIRSGRLEEPSETLAERHDGKKEGNVSRYLLSQAGLADKQIRKDRYNRTDSLSFRNISHLCIVDETAMQAEVPPALTGINTTKTKEIAVLKLLLQGEDDSDLIAVETRAERSRLLNARSEVLDRLIGDLEEQLRESADLGQLRSQQDRLNASISQETASIADLSARRSQLAGQLSSFDRLANTTQGRVSDVETLGARFRLLLNQYDSDLKRLEMIAEAGTMLGYFSPGQCVFCGADPEHQHFNDDCADDTTQFRDSVLAEQQKTASLRADLIDTLTDLDSQLAGLRRRQAGLTLAISETRHDLQGLDHALRPHQGGLNELLAARSDVEKLLGLHVQIERLNAVKTELATEGQAETSTAVAGMQLSALAALSTEIGNRLRAWGVPDADSVRYDRNEQDTVAGNQLRSAHGKGVRAILHAAFNIGLAQYCFDRDLPHPGFLILDSPLVTYRPPDDSEEGSTDEIDPSIAGRFYADIQDSFDGQVVIMENMDPPDELAELTIDIPFTRNPDSGRFGFFPLAPV